MRIPTSTRKAWLSLSFILAAPLALGQASDQPTLFGVSCQPIASSEVLRPEFAVENFNASLQGFITCETAVGESNQDIFIAGALPLDKMQGLGLSLEDFNIWNQTPALSELFVQSNLGLHPVRQFNPDAAGINPEDADAILGHARSRPVKNQVCQPGGSGGPTCSIQQVEECKMVYGREECTIVEKEVCTTNPSTPPVCHEETTFTYFRNVATLTGAVNELADSYCPTGIVGRRTTVQYGRVVNERQCCESKVVSGILTNVCSNWEIY